MDSSCYFTLTKKNYDRDKNRPREVGSRNQWIIMKRYRLKFSNSNNAWYDADSFYGTEVEMLIYANEKLNNKENKLYNLWIYDENDNRMYRDYTVGCFHRGKKLEKLINDLKTTI